MTGAELFVACLEEAGIEIIYGLPGEENTDLMLALDQSSIQFVLTRHEQSAAFMASTYGRLTGRPAGCLATLGPGATNLVTGVADAQFDFVPMVAITGQGSTDRIAKSESHQVMDLTTLFEPVTKLSQTLMSAAEIPGLVAEALRVATEPRPGAVHLSLPENVASEDVDARPLSCPSAFVPVASAEAVKAATEVLGAAKNPIVLAGAGVVRSGAAADVVAFAVAHRLPVAVSFMGNGIISAEHDLYLGTVGQPFDDHIDAAFHEADLIVAIGFDPIEFDATKLADTGMPKVLHVADVPAAVDVGWLVQADVVGIVATSLKALSAELANKKWPISSTVLDVKSRLQQEQDRSPDHQAGAFLPEHILRIVEEDLRSDDVVLSGVGTHKLKIARSLRAKRPGQIIIANGSAGMGIALPGAIAAACLDRKGRTLAICGDGEFLINLQEMETAVRLGTAITVLLWEDGGYGLIEEKQETARGSHTELAFLNPDWADLCKAFKWDHQPVSTAGQLRHALVRSRVADGPVLITLKVDYSEGLEPQR